MTAPVEVVAHVDGGARGNPGPAGVGVHIATRSGRTLAEIAEPIGYATNNVAEYSALIRALEAAAAMGARRVTLRADSLLVIEQMRGVYKVKHADMKRLHARAGAIASTFESVTFEHVPRERNKRADALVNAAIDAWLDEHGDDPPPPREDATLF